MNQAKFSMGGEAMARSHHESDNEYRSIIAILNSHWRVIACKDDIQWIIQKSEKTSRGLLWRSWSYHRTNQSLKRVLCSLKIEISPIASKIIDKLPMWIEQGRAK